MSVQQKLDVLDLVIRTLQSHEKALDRILGRLEELALLENTTATLLMDLADKVKKEGK